MLSKLLVSTLIFYGLNQKQNGARAKRIRRWRTLQVAACLRQGGGGGWGAGPTRYRFRRHDHASGIDEYERHIAGQHTAAVCFFYEEISNFSEQDVCLQAACAALLAGGEGH